MLTADFFRPNELLNTLSFLVISGVNVSTGSMLASARIGRRSYRIPVDTNICNYITPSCPVTPNRNYEYKLSAVIGSTIRRVSLKCIVTFLFGSSIWIIFNYNNDNIPNNIVQLVCLNLKWRKSLLSGAWN